MKLSDAIRLGALPHPQAFNSGRHAGSCALRAAADAVGIQDNNGVLNYFELSERWPLLLHRCPPCPVCAAREPETMCMVYHLNDHHRWTREQVADFVERLEAGDNEPAVPRADKCVTEAMGQPGVSTRAPSSSSSFADDLFDLAVTTARAQFGGKL